MKFKQLTFPETLLISLQDAKDHLRVTDTNQAAVIKDCIRSATSLIETYTNQILQSGTYCAYLDINEFQAFCEIDLWKYPITDITSIKYLNTSGAETTFSSSYYSTDLTDSPARVLPTTIPTVQLNVVNPIRIYFTAGYTNSDQISPELIGWVKIFIAFFYQTRQPEYTGVQVSEIAYNYEKALDKFRKDPIA